MKILVPVDDSPHARAAVDFVKRMSWPGGGQVLVLSAARPVVSAYAEVYAAGGGYSEQVYHEQVKHCEDLVARVSGELKQGGLRAEGHVVRGDPREAIVHLAKTEKVDLVVMGSHGRSGLARLLLGSVASYVVSHSPCNVLVVKLPPGTV